MRISTVFSRSFLASLACVAAAHAQDTIDGSRITPGTLPPAAMVANSGSPGAGTCFFGDARWGTCGDLLSTNSYANPSWLSSLAWSKITGSPTSLAGYGITDPVLLSTDSYANPSWLSSLAWSKITGSPTSLAGYGITDPVLLSTNSLSELSGAAASARSNISAAATVTCGSNQFVNSASSASSSCASVYVNPSTLVSGQLKITTTGTAVCPPSAALSSGNITVTAADVNVAPLVVGTSSVTNTINGTGNGFVLKPGASVPEVAANASAVCVNGTAGDWFSYLGS